MPRMRAIVCIILISIGLGCAGCGSSVTVSEWQAALDQFAAEHANDDLSFLREHDGDSSARTFAVLGANTPEKSTDITGVLLGRRAIGAREWLVFLLGRVKKREVEDIRLALRSDDDGPAAWVVGDDDDGGLKKYRTHKDDQWRARHAGRESPPRHTFEFPSEEDVFGLDVRGQQVIAVEERSGARWTVKVSD